jgi:micrococcal nuclease
MTRRLRIPRFRGSRALRNWLALLVALAAIVRVVWLGREVPLPQEGEEVAVARVVDGDTLLIAGDHRVRLLGVDTPETKRPDFPVEKFGPEASEFTRAAVEGRMVRLEFDRERHDKYGRLLAYVYIDDRLLNEELIRAGLARAMTRFPFREDMKERFREAERQAQSEHRGIWSSSRDSPKGSSRASPRGR